MTIPTSLFLSLATVILLPFPAIPQAQWPPLPPNNSNWDNRIGTSVEGPFAVGARVAVVGPNGNIYASGVIEIAPGEQRPNLAIWDGQRWRVIAERFQMGTSNNVEVTAIAVDSNGDVYVCGNFTEVVYNNGANTEPVNRVARWDVVSNQWSSLAGGVATFPLCIAIAGNYVYVGNITQVFDNGGIPTNVQSIARWDKNASVWSPVGTGISGGMNSLISLISDGVNVYSGGNFTTAGGITVNHIARWDGSQWSALGQGLYSPTSVYASDLALNQSNELIVGGFFGGGTNGNGSQVPGKILRWDGSQWISESNGLIINSLDFVNQIEVDGSDAICAYVFLLGAGDRIARKVGNQWTIVGTFSGEFIGAIAGRPGRLPEGLYMGGIFQRIIDPSVPTSHSITNNAQYIAGQGWQQIRDNVMPGSNGIIYAIASSSGATFPGTPDYLYAGGVFTSIAGRNITNIARSDGREWKPLGGGINGPVYAIIESGDLVFVGGSFSAAKNSDSTSITVSNIAAWNTSSEEWFSIGGTSGPVYALEAYFLGTINLFAGGEFLNAIDVNATVTQVNSIAEFRRPPGFGAWEVHPVGQGVTGGLGIVRAITRHGERYTPEDDMYIGGSFAGVVTNTGTTIPTANIARWNVQTGTWRNVGQGVNGEVRALALHLGTLPPVWIGGDFTTGTNDNGSTIASPHFILWNDASNQWNNLQGGTNGSVYAIERVHTTHYDGVFFGGDFSFGLYPPPGVIQRPLSNVGVYVLDNRLPLQPVRPDWNQRGDGTDGPVFALHQIKPCGTNSGENLYVGGDFQFAGGLFSGGLSRWKYVWRSPFTIVPSAAGVRNTMGMPGGGVRLEGRIYLCSPLNDSPGPLPIVLADSLGFRESARVDTLPVQEFIGLDVYQEGPSGQLLFSTDSFYIGQAVPTLIALVGVDDVSLFAPNPDGRSTALNVVSKPLPIGADSTTWVNVMLFHAVTDAPSVDVSIQGSGTIAQNLFYGDATDSIINLAPGNYVFEIRRSSNAQLLGSYPFDLTANAGDVLVLGLTGFLDPVANQNGPAMSLDEYTTGTTILTDVYRPAGGEIPKEFSLSQNYPNPFNPVTTIEYQIPTASHVTIKVFDLLGRDVRTLVNEEKTVGSYSFRWNAEGVATGVYLYRLQAGAFVQTRKLMLIR